MSNPPPDDTEQPGGHMGQSLAGLNAIFVHSKLDDHGLDPFAFRIYCHLARRSNRGNALAWPGIDSIAKTTGISPSKVKMSLADLEAANMIQVTRQSMKTNRYWLTPASDWKVFKNPDTAATTWLRGEDDEQQEPPGGPDRSHHMAPDRSHLVAAKGIQHEGNPDKGDPEQPPLGLPDPKPVFPAAAMVEAWNRLCVSLTAITSIRGERAKQAAARWKECKNDLLTWEEVLKRLEASDFATGRRQGTDGRKWKATFDWFVAPGNFDKVREGKYDNRPTETPKTDAHTIKRKIGWGHAQP